MKITLRGFLGGIIVTSIVVWIMTSCIIPLLTIFNIDSNIIDMVNAYSFVSMLGFGLASYLKSEKTADFRDKVKNLFKRQKSLKLNKIASEKRKEDDCGCKKK